VIIPTILFLCLCGGAIWLGDVCWRLGDDARPYDNNDIGPYAMAVLSWIVACVCLVLAELCAFGILK